MFRWLRDGGGGDAPPPASAPAPDTPCGADGDSQLQAPASDATTASALLVTPVAARPAAESTADDEAAAPVGLLSPATTNSAQRHRPRLRARRSSSGAGSSNVDDDCAWDGDLDSELMPDAPTLDMLLQGEYRETVDPDSDDDGGEPADYEEDETASVQAGAASRGGAGTSRSPDGGPVGAELGEARAEADPIAVLRESASPPSEHSASDTADGVAPAGGSGDATPRRLAAQVAAQRVSASAALLRARSCGCLGASSGWHRAGCPEL